MPVAGGAKNLVRGPHVRKTDFVPFGQGASGVSVQNGFCDLVWGSTLQAELMAEFVVRHYRLRSLWVETDRSAQFGVVDEVAKVRGRKRRRPEPPHHHADKSIVAFMDALKAGGGQDFDSGFAGDIVRSSGFCQRNFGALRDQVFTDRRGIYFLCKSFHRPKIHQPVKTYAN